MVSIHAGFPYGLAVLVFLVSGYFVPTILASAHGRRTFNVFLVNLVFGWTFVGWLAALYFATRSADDRFVRTT